MKKMIGLFLCLTLVMACAVPGSQSPVDVMVAVGSGGMIARSLDHGATWELSMANPNLPSSKILQGNFTFGGNVRVLGSFNQGSQQQGVNVASASGTIGSVSNPYFGDEYVRGTHYQQIGQTWTGPIANPFLGGTIFSIASGSSVYVAVGAGGRIARSVDFGATWGALIANNFAVVNITSVEYANGIFVAGAADGTISRSTDLGVTWSALIANPFGTAVGSVSGMKYGNGILIAVGNDAGGVNGRISRSTDLGVTWSAFVTNPFGASLIVSVSFVNGVFAAGGGGAKIARSSDLGLTWGSLITNPFTGANFIRSIAAGNQVLVAVGDSGEIARSIDFGVTWGSLITNPFSAGSGILSVSYNFGVFQAGASGATARSYDNGLTWGALLPNPFGANPIQGIASSSTNLAAVAQGGVIATSGWNAVFSSAPEQLYVPVFSNFGTVTAINFSWRQVANHYFVTGKFTAGVVGAGEARISLPNGAISDAALIASIVPCGYGGDTVTFNPIVCLIEPNVAYITLARSGVTNYLAKANGNAWGNNQVIGVKFDVPITGLNV